MHCEARQVDVVCMVPGQVVSGMNEGPPSLMVSVAGAALARTMLTTGAAAQVPTSFDWVRSALVSLAPGWISTRPKNVITPWWPHYLALALSGFGPQWIGDSVARSMVSEMKRKWNESKKSL